MDISSLFAYKEMIIFFFSNMHTIRSVLTSSVLVLRLLLRRPGQSTKIPVYAFSLSYTWYINSR